MFFHCCGSPTEYGARYSTGRTVLGGVLCQDKVGTSSVGWEPVCNIRSTHFPSISRFALPQLQAIPLQTNSSTRLRCRRAIEALSRTKLLLVSAWEGHCVNS